MSGVMPRDRASICGTMRILLLLSLVLLGACTRAPQTRPVQIESIPSGAVVWVDGENAGITPVEIAVTGDKVVMLRLAMRDHQDWTTKLDPSSAAKVQATLVPRAQGSIEFVTVPPGAEVMVNGERRGETPIMLEDLLLGSYEIRCQLENFEPHVETIEVSDSELVRREVKLVDKLVNFYQAQIDVEEKPKTLTSYTDLAHQLFVTDRTEEACAVLLDGLMEMYRRGTKDTRLVAELDRTLSGQYFREGSRDEIRARIVALLRQRFDLIEEPTAVDLRAFIHVLVHLKEKQLAKTELETAVAFFPEDKGIRKLQKEVLAEIEPPPLTPKEQAEYDKAMAVWREMKLEYGKSKGNLERARRSALQAEAAFKQMLARRETVDEKTQENRASLTELRPRLGELQAAMVELEEEKAAIVANPDKLSYQELRKAMSGVAEKISETDSALTTARNEVERLEEALKDNESFVTHFKTIEAESQATIDAAKAAFAEAEADFEAVKKRYDKVRRKYYDVIYKKKKRK